MPDYSIAGSTGTTGLSPLGATPAAGDLFALVDVDDTTTPPAGSKGSNKSVTYAQLLASPPGGTTAFLRADLAWAAPPAGGGGAPGLQLVYVDQLAGVDPTGATDSSAAIRTKQTALGSAPYRLVFGAGSYLMSSAFVNFSQDQGATAQGSSVSTFNWSGAGPLITAALPSGFNGSQNAGAFAGFTIAGPFGTGTSAGIKYGDLQGIVIDDVHFSGLPGGAILGYTPSGSGWAEEAFVTRCVMSECGAGLGANLQYLSTSFDYSYFDILVVVEANIDVLQLNAGAQMQGVDFGCRGNVHGGASSNTGAIIGLEHGTGAVASGHAYMTNATLRVSMEASGTVAHHNLIMGSNNGASQFSGFGLFNIYNAGGQSQGYSNPNFLPMSFAGMTNAPAGSFGNTPGLVTLSGTHLNTVADRFGNSGGTFFWDSVDIITYGLNNGAQTIAFNYQNDFMRKVTALIKQPASGAAGTITWPANVLWLGGSAPTLTTTNGWTDEVEFVYLPGNDKWYGRYVGTYHG